MSPGSLGCDCQNRTSSLARYFHNLEELPTRTLAYAPRALLAAAQRLRGVHASGIDRAAFDAGEAATLAGRLLGYTRESAEDALVRFEWC